MTKNLIHTLAIALVAMPLSANAQNATRVIRATYVAERITADGVLDEPAWERAAPSGDFWQFFPADTVRARLATEIRMVYDDHTLYVGVRVEVPAANYVVSTLRRDFNGTTNDNVTLMFDTYRDGLNAYLFGVTPYGVQRDVLISGGGSSTDGFNTNWDAKWRAEARRFPDHYVVELAIPLGTLAHPAGSTRWRFQAYRWDFQANERSVWSRVPQNQLMTNLAFTGEVVFDRPIGASARPLAVIPYAYSSAASDFVLGDRSTDADVGADAKVAVGRGLTLDLTVNPDFSNVEADEFITNLTRFEIRRPERRQFFLDNSDLFAGFGSSRDDIPFFSRRIGIARDTAGVPVENRVLAGVRLSGNLDERWRLGVLNVHTAARRPLEIPSNNNLMVALQRRIFARSNLSAFVLNRQAVGNYEFLDPADAYNRVAGLDFNLATADNVWTGTFYLHKSFQPGDDAGNYSAQTLMRYNTRRYGFTADFVYVDQDYRSDLGFVPRRDLFKSGKAASRTFWPEGGVINNHGIRLLALHFWRPTLDYQLTDHDYRATWNAVFADQSTVELEYSNKYIFLTGPFDPTRSAGGVPLPANTDYRFNDVTLQYASDASDDLSVRLGSTVGEFFNGRRVSTNAQLSYNLRPRAVLTLGGAWDRIRLPDPHPDADLWLASPGLDLTFSTSVFWSTLVQYSTQLENLGINSRLQWRFAPLSDLYLVYNDSYLTDRFSPRYRSVTLKVSYWLSP
jgi:hypothetical protein